MKPGVRAVHRRTGGERGLAGLVQGEQRECQRRGVGERRVPLAQPEQHQPGQHRAHPLRLRLHRLHWQRRFRAGPAGGRPRVSSSSRFLWPLQSQPHCGHSGQGRRASDCQRGTVGDGRLLAGTGTARPHHAAARGGKPERAVRARWGVGRSGGGRGGQPEVPPQRGGPAAAPLCEPVPAPRQLPGEPLRWGDERRGQWHRGAVARRGLNRQLETQQSGLSP